MVVTQKLPPKLNAATHWMTSRQPLIPGESEEALKAAAKFKDLDYDARIGIPITFRSLRIAVEREKEFGGHLREWPDLRADDEHIIQMKV